MLDLLVASDADSAYRLSGPASKVLALAKAVLVVQMEINHAPRQLSGERIAELIGRGPGLAVAATAELEFVSKVASNRTAG